MSRTAAPLPALLLCNIALAAAPRSPTPAAVDGHFKVNTIAITDNPRGRVLQLVPGN